MELGEAGSGAGGAGSDEVRAQTMNRLALAKSLLPKRYAPYGDKSAGIIVNDERTRALTNLFAESEQGSGWQKVKNLVRARRQGTRVPPYVVSSTEGGMDYGLGRPIRGMTGTHRATANQILERQGRSDAKIQEIKFHHLSKPYRKTFDRIRRRDPTEILDTFDEHIKSGYSKPRWKRQMIRRKYRGLYKRGLLPDDYFPYGEGNSLHQVMNWQKVKNLVRANDRGEFIPPYLIRRFAESTPDMAVTGTHRATASNLVNRRIARGRSRKNRIRAVRLEHLKDKLRKPIENQFFFSNAPDALWDADKRVKNAFLVAHKKGNWRKPIKRRFRGLYKRGLLPKKGEYKPYGKKSLHGVMNWGKVRNILRSLEKPGGKDVPPIVVSKNPKGDRLTGDESGARVRHFTGTHRSTVLQLARRRNRGAFASGEKTIHEIPIHHLKRQVTKPYKDDMFENLPWLDEYVKNTYERAGPKWKKRLLRHKYRHFYKRSQLLKLLPQTIARAQTKVKARRVHWDNDVGRNWLPHEDKRRVKNRVRALELQHKLFGWGALRRAEPDNMEYKRKYDEVRRKYLPAKRRVLLEKRGLLPKAYYPYGKKSSFPVLNWKMVRDEVLAIEEGRNRPTPFLYSKKGLDYGLGPMSTLGFRDSDRVAILRLLQRRNKDFKESQGVYRIHFKHLKPEWKRQFKNELKTIREKVRRTGDASLAQNDADTKISGPIFGAWRQHPKSLIRRKHFARYGLKRRKG